MYASATNITNTTVKGPLPKSQWINWCRLCAKVENKDNINFLYQNEEEEQSEYSSKKLSIQKAVDKYFGVQISFEDSLPKTLCPDCLSLASFLISFNESVARVQQMYHYLNDFHTIVSNNGFDFNSVRLNYGATEQSRDQSFFKHSDPQYMDTEIQYLFSSANPQSLGDNNMLQIQPDKNVKLKDCTYSAEKEVSSKNSNDFHQEGYKNCSYSNEEETDNSSFSSEEENHTQGDDKDCSSSSEENGEGRIIKASFLKDFKIDITCKECELNFTEVTTYFDHLLQTHNHQINDKHWSCPLCDNRSYTMSQSLRRHILNVHAQKIKCPECMKYYKSNAALEEHVRNRHTKKIKEKQFICEECGLAVMNSRNLTKHMLRHTDIAPYECNICKNRFKDKDRLKRHMRTTHSSKRYICNICGVQLKTKITYKNHLLVHSDIAQYKCDYCGKSFKVSKDLKHHFLVHIDLKPYSCNFCERAFSTGWNCNLHVKKMHPNEYAEQKALGGKVITNNMPKFETLKAIIDNLIKER